MTKARDLVDVATGVLDSQGFLDDVPEQFIQELCEKLYNAFDKYLEGVTND